MTSFAAPGAQTARHLLSKVPAITVWFWIIKILCTTVGESFADYIDLALGVGLLATAGIFTVVTAAVLALQMSRRQYHPGFYLLTVVLMSITGTLYTDILTDQAGVPLWVSSALFAVVLAIVFAIWFRRENTLSIHSIVSMPREAFYWLTVLVTFALGTALGDWTLELTGSGPGVSIFLPLALIAITAALWRFGANPVLTFWVAYILSRPLGANTGDWLGLTTAEGGLGLGTFTTSIIFLALILATVVYLSVSRADVDRAAATDPRTDHRPVSMERRRRAHLILGAAAIATIALLVTTASLPHESSLAAEGSAPSCSASSTPLTQSEAQTAVRAHYPASNVTELQGIVTDTLSLVTQGDQAGAASRATDLETTWDDNQATLNFADCQAWTVLDQQIDPVLKSVRAGAPDPATETRALKQLSTTLGAS